MINPTGLLLATARCEGQQLGAQQVGVPHSCPFLSQHLSWDTGKPSWEHVVTSTMDLSMGRSRGRAGLGWFGVGAPTQAVLTARVLLWGAQAEGAEALGAHGGNWCCSSSCSLQKLTQVPGICHGAGPGLCHPVCHQQG